MQAAHQQQQHQQQQVGIAQLAQAIQQQAAAQQANLAQLQNVLQLQQAQQAQQAQQGGLVQLQQALQAQQAHQAQLQAAAAAAAVAAVQQQAGGAGQGQWPLGQQQQGPGERRGPVEVLGAGQTRQTPRRWEAHANPGYVAAVAATCFCFVNVLHLGMDKDSSTHPALCCITYAHTAAGAVSFVCLGVLKVTLVQVRNQLVVALSGMTWSASPPSLSP